jgi:excisionase family DNA binding protein
MPEPEYFTRREACAYLRLSLKTLERRVRAGQIPIIKVGTAVRLARADLDRFMAAHRVGAGDAA